MTKFRNSIKGVNPTYEKFTLPEKTFPGMSFSNQQLIERMSVGLPVLSGKMEYNNGEWQPVIKDLTDVDYYKEKLQLVQQKIKKVEQDKQDYEKREAFKKAVNEEVLKQIKAGQTTSDEVRGTSPA